MKLPDPKKPLQVTVSPWEVAFGQKVDADRLVREDQEWLASRQRLMDARKRDDAKLLRSAELSRRNAPDLKAAPSGLESTLSDLARGAKTALTEGIPHFVGNISNLLQGLPEVPSEYRRSPGVFQEDLPTSWTEDAANMVLDPSNLVGGAMLKPLGRALKKALPVAVPAVSSAYAGDAEAGGLQKMLQMMYRGRSSFTPIEERAMFMSPTPRYAEEYAKRRVGQIGGDRMVDSYLVDPFGVERRGHNITPEGGGNLQSIIAYPKTGEAEYMGSRKFAKGGLARLAARLAADSAPARRGVAEVVKEKGGNWLTGSVEDSLSGLKSAPLKSGMKREIVPTERGSVNLIDKDPEGNIYEVREFLTPVYEKQIAPVDTWIDKQLTNYVRNEMATPQDPIRALAEQGILHVDPATLRNMASHAGMSEKEWLAMSRNNSPHGKELGKSRPAKSWEDATDSQLDVRTVKEFEDESYFPREHYPWVKDETVFADFPQWSSNPVKYFSSDLGFDHLIDELSNAINPESGLPRHLQFPADRLNKVSVPQAVERVAQINAWRAAQKAEADAMRANNAATTLFKEYPENNPLGLRWVELKAPDRFADPAQKEEFGDLGRYAQRTLSDALEYEGDTMGHCVGGYCDDVLSGRSRIFSLRDTKGQPHTTIEVSPGKVTREYLESLPDPDHPDKFEPDVLGVRNTFRDYVQRHRSGNGDFDEFALKALQEHGYPLPPQRIVQIKGKQNKAPNPEYLPFVQDFVRSGKWSDVGDLKNTGLWKNPKTGTFHTVEEAEADPLLQEIYDSRNLNPDGTWNGGRYANGGSIQAKPVLTVQDLQAIINQLSRG